MTKSKRGRYTLEFKQEAARLVESGQSQAAAARSLGVVEQTLGNWVREHRAGTLKGAIVAYNDPYFPTVGRGRHYDLNMTCTPLDNLGQYDAVVIVTDHSSYDYRSLAEQSQLLVDTRNATKGIDSPNIVRC